MKTHLWLLASLSRVWFFLRYFFFPLSQVMTGTIWTDFCSTIFVFFVSRTVWDKLWARAND